MNIPAQRQQISSTAYGLVAIAFWCTVIAFSRGVVEQLGIFTTVAATSLLGGGIGLLVMLLNPRTRAGLRRLPAVYLVGGCALVVLYLTVLNLAIGLSSTRRQVIEVGILNYLWPALTLLLSVPMLHKRARWLLLPGALLAFAGAALATLPPGAWQGHGLAANWLPYALATAGAIAWALFSNLSQRWAGDAETGAMPLFIFVTGLVTLALRAYFPEHPHWTTPALGATLYLALGPTLLAYACWEHAMRKGNLVLLASVSYLIPLVSTFISILYLHVTPNNSLWLACGLVIAGAIMCNASVYEEKEAAVAD